MTETNCTLEVVKQQYDHGEYDPYATTVLAVDEAEGKRLVHTTGWSYRPGRGCSMHWEKAKLIVEILVQRENWYGGNARWVCAIKHDGEWRPVIETPYEAYKAVIEEGGRLISRAAFKRNAKAINDFFGCDDVAEMLDPKGTVVLSEA